MTGSSDCFIDGVDGLRAKLAEIEAVLLTSGMLAEAAVTVHEGAHGDPILVAHVVPCAPADFRPAALLERLHDKLPGYPIPSRFVLLDELPLDLDGEIDREALVEGQPQSGVFSSAPIIAATYDPLTAQLAALWADTLDVSVVLPDDDFFDLGGDSLRAARLVLRIADAYRVQFPVHALYEARTLRACAMVVQRAQRGEEALSGTGPEHWQADARLPADIRALIDGAAGRARASVDAWRTGEVFLTGATGFLGSFLLRELLTSTTACVHCLVRTNNRQVGLLRLRQALGKYGLWQDSFAQRIHVVPGDLGRPRFGLDAPAFEALAYTVDAIFHAGDRFNLVEPYPSHRATNVGGTADVLRLAATGVPKPVHHVSSIMVFGPSGFFGGPRRVHEGDDLDDFLQYLSFDLGYAASKWVAEQMVWEAARAGLPVTVYRPGFLAGHSRSGVGDPEGFIGRLVRGAIQIGAFPDLPRQRLEFVPVDYVGRAILHIAGQADHQNRAHHLVPPDPALSIELNDFFALVASFGYRLSRWPYHQWLEQTLQDCRERDNPLCPLLPLLAERVYKGELTRLELREDTPAYDAANALAALASSDLELPAIGRQRMAKYLRRWLAADRLPPVHAAAAGH
ncbi:thioester reductase domain-containing protein [Nannocystis exedens]|uniref:Thioester reductase domain-containing protein n=1 Tax=Nannocystis exedens TaxID=54 RepID=A0A1I2CZU7_9BACT|nr:thioester reductase domain-containing protein [Nannocystis exedens]PCC68688.1 peptide synthetase [Nannocystis exedens]SFE73808.1 thioester reductase domain-containing protein [Nannocystis exedens]